MSPQYGNADVKDVFAANHTTEEIEPPVAQEVVEDVPATQDLKKDATRKAVETDSSSSSSDDSDSSYLDQPWSTKCNEVIAIGDEINYFHFMVVHGTLSAMSTGRVTALNPHNDYMITLNTGDVIPSGAIIQRVREIDSSGALVPISGKRKWQDCTMFQCQAGGTKTGLSDAVYARSARVSGVFNAIADSLVDKGLPVASLAIPFKPLLRLHQQIMLDWKMRFGTIFKLEI